MIQVARLDVAVIGVDLAICLWCTVMNPGYQQHLRNNHLYTCSIVCTSAR